MCRSAAPTGSRPRQPYEEAIWRVVAPRRRDPEDHQRPCHVFGRQGAGWLAPPAVEDAGTERYRPQVVVEQTLVRIAPCVSPEE